MFAAGRVLPRILSLLSLLPLHLLLSSLLQILQLLLLLPSLLLHSTTQIGHTAVCVHPIRATPGAAKFVAAAAARAAELLLLLLLLRWRQELVLPVGRAAAGRRLCSRVTAAGADGRPAAAHAAKGSFCGKAGCLFV